MKRISIIFILILILALLACYKTIDQARNNIIGAIRTTSPTIIDDEMKETPTKAENNSSLGTKDTNFTLNSSTEAFWELSGEHQMGEALSNIAWIKESNVNLRSEPSRDSNIIGILSCAQEVVIYDDMGEWKRVFVNDKEGYVFSEYVATEKIDQSETSAQAMISIYDQSEEDFLIAIDAGHQAKGNYEMEPIGPDASQSKAKVATGTQGIVSKAPEYVLTLEVSLKLREELLARGYKVFMVRETHDVNISNKERAEMATEAAADIFIRIHADGSVNSNVSGILTLCPTSQNPYIPHLYTQSRVLSDHILKSMVSTTGGTNRGVLEVDNMSGINWATMPVTIIEMGLMTNPDEDQLMQTDEYQKKLVDGIADGIEMYFITQDTSED